MAITTLSSRSFNQHINDAKKAADKGPVFITKRGKPAHVLLNIDEYRRLLGRQPTITELLAMPGTEDIDIDIPELRDFPQPADLS